MKAASDLSQALEGGGSQRRRFILADLDLTHVSGPDVERLVAIEEKLAVVGKRPAGRAQMQ